ncbi:hypothetical protein MM213_18150 [Belliella sp. R4-6]|uniref:Uncharacterized protein n=1 Tax=Belliella alkalica TaxID=1730871 RepID=A0ABS9VG55_9BACT|nr:hypothetical protein [Belliella alkalica]MCH7415428.1 hypothetical protein [Belliella alkalica]
MSETLQVSAKERSIDYCGMLAKAINLDEKSIKELSELNFGDASGYDHGAVLVELITKVGETKYIQSISGIDKAQKSQLKAYLGVGLEYGSVPNLTSRRIETAFPALNNFLSH